MRAREEGRYCGEDKKRGRRRDGEKKEREETGMERVLSWREFQREIIGKSAP